jgi:hypothetical protein
MSTASSSPYKHTNSSLKYFSDGEKSENPVSHVQYGLPIEQTECCFGTFYVLTKGAMFVLNAAIHHASWPNTVLCRFALSACVSETPPVQNDARIELGGVLN